MDKYLRYEVRQVGPATYDVYDRFEGRTVVSSESFTVADQIAVSLHGSLPATGELEEVAESIRANAKPMPPPVRILAACSGGRIDELIAEPGVNVEYAVLYAIDWDDEEEPEPIELPDWATALLDEQSKAQIVKHNAEVAAEAAKE